MSVFFPGLRCLYILGLLGAVGFSPDDDVFAAVGSDRGQDGLCPIRCRPSKNLRDEFPDDAPAAYAGLQAVRYAVVEIG